MSSEDVYILGIKMTKFGKHKELDTLDLACEATFAALADGGVTMKDMGIIADGNLMGGAAPIAQLIQKQAGQTGIPAYNVSNACASCSGTDFKPARVATQGVLRSFTIVAFAAPGIPVPFVSAIVDCEGTSVRANIVNIPPDPENVKLGMPVRLTTFPVGSDSEGVEAINFGFEPAA